MLKENITIQDVCDLLNEMLKLDRSCLTALVNHREICNAGIANHPTIQVTQYPEDISPKVGLIGVLNGLFGIRTDGMGAMCMEVEDDGSIITFKETPDKKVDIVSWTLGFSDGFYKTSTKEKIKDQESYDIGVQDGKDSKEDNFILGIREAEIKCFKITSWQILNPNN